MIALSEEAQAVACIRIKVPGSDFVRTNQAFHLFAVDELLTKLSEKDKTVRS